MKEAILGKIRAFLFQDAVNEISILLDQYKSSIEKSCADAISSDRQAQDKNALVATDTIMASRAAEKASAATNGTPGV